MPHYTPSRLDCAELHDLGRLLAADLYAGIKLADCQVLEVDDILLGAIMAGTLTPQAALALVVSWNQTRVDTKDLTEQSATKLSELQARLATFLAGRTDDIAQAGTADVQAWVLAKYLPKRRGPAKPPDDATINNRIWAADSFFRALRLLGKYEGHPLLDYPRRPKGGDGCRPLLDSEVDLGRSFAARTRRDTRGPGAWAIVEAGAATGELMRVTVADSTARPGRVWLTGDSRHLARWVTLTPTGAIAVAARAEAVAARDSDPAAGLIYEGDGTPQSQQASACDAIHETLKRAGLRADPAVKPGSLRAWAGVSEYRRTGDLLAVATVLGCRSLDEAARIMELPTPQAAPPPPHRERS
ncbi:MAG TPA: hypothetical protein VFP54_12995 [Acidimicrobiales bacterium]|nr:hypothetical protein [Acidimicrobiales bacterium]